VPVSNVLRFGWFCVKSTRRSRLRPSKWTVTLPTGSVPWFPVGAPGGGRPLLNIAVYGTPFDDCHLGSKYPLMTHLGSGALLEFINRLMKAELCVEADLGHSIRPCIRASDPGKHVEAAMTQSALDGLCQGTCCFLHIMHRGRHCAARRWISTGHWLSMAATFSTNF
jgi:hypothetical protein